MQKLIIPSGRQDILCPITMVVVVRFVITMPGVEDGCTTPSKTYQDFVDVSFALVTDLIVWKQNAD